MFKDDQSYQSRDVPKARVEPNRKWFGNTRVISQESLSAFRTAMDAQARDPYQVLLKTNQIPMSLIRDGQGNNGVKEHEAKMTVQSSPFAEAFGPKSQRKRVKLNVGSLEDLAGESEKMRESYDQKAEEARALDGAAGDREAGEENGEGTTMRAREPIFSKGQSKRIYNELHKVIDSSDVIIQCLDVR